MAAEGSKAGGKAIRPGPVSPNPPRARAGHKPSRSCSGVHILSLRQPLPILSLPREPLACPHTSTPWGLPAREAEGTKRGSDEGSRGLEGGRADPQSRSTEKQGRQLDLGEGKADLRPLRVPGKQAWQQHVWIPCLSPSHLLPSSPPLKCPKALELVRVFRVVPLPECLLHCQRPLRQPRLRSSHGPGLQGSSGQCQARPASPGWAIAAD